MAINVCQVQKPGCVGTFLNRANLIFNRHRLLNSSHVCGIQPCQAIPQAICRSAI